MLDRLMPFLCDESGEDLVEYGMLLAFAAIVVTVSMFQDQMGLKSALVAAFQKAKAVLSH